MDPRLKRTKYAAHAATLAEQFEGELAGFPVGAHRIEMTVPEGSTGGGVQALQHIRLVPSDEDAKGLRTFVIGNANQVTKVAELRSLDYVDKACVERFGESTGLDPAQYATCMAVAAKFLTTWGMTVTRLAGPSSSGREPSRKSSRMSGSVIFMLVVGMLAVFALGVVVGVLVTESRMAH